MRFENLGSEVVSREGFYGFGKVLMRKLFDFRSGESKEFSLQGGVDGLEMCVNDGAFYFFSDSELSGGGGEARGGIRFGVLASKVFEEEEELRGRGVWVFGYVDVVESLERVSILSM